MEATSIHGRLAHRGLDSYMGAYEMKSETQEMFDVQSDGTTAGTVVTDSVTGKKMGRLQSVTLSCESAQEPQIAASIIDV